MIRDKIKEIGDNVDKFEDIEIYQFLSNRYRYENIRIEIELMWFWGFQSIKLKIKDNKNQYSTFEFKEIELSKEEKKAIYKAFKCVRKENKRKEKNDTDKWSLEKKKRQNDLLNSINFKGEL